MGIFLCIVAIYLAIGVGMFRVVAFQSKASRYKSAKVAIKEAAIAIVAWPYFLWAVLKK